MEQQFSRTRRTQQSSAGSNNHEVSSSPLRYRVGCVSLSVPRRESFIGVERDFQKSLEAQSSNSAWKELPVWAKGFVVAMHLGTFAAAAVSIGAAAAWGIRALVGYDAAVVEQCAKLGVVITAVFMAGTALTNTFCGLRGGMAGSFVRFR